MAETVLVAETGRPTGSPNARRMLREDIIPGVVYGQGMTPISVSVARRDLRIALSGSAGTNTVLDLTVDGTVYPAIVKELQRHPVRRTVQHVDFLQVNLNEEITVSVPIVLTGEAHEVVVNGGFVDPAVDTLDVRTTPRNIPDSIEIDITNMTPENSVITLGDLTMPAGVEAMGDPEMAVATALFSRQGETEEIADSVEAAEAQAADEEAAEGGDAEAADGGDADADAGE